MHVNICKYLFSKAVAGFKEVRTFMMLWFVLLVLYNQKVFLSLQLRKDRVEDVFVNVSFDVDCSPLLVLISLYFKQHHCSIN